MRRRTFLSLTGTATGSLLLRPSAQIFSRSLLRSENRESDLLIDLVDAAMTQGAEYADARLLSTRAQTVQLRKDVVAQLTDVEDRGFLLRVFKNGGWASSAISGAVEIHPRHVARQALQSALTASQLSPVPFDPMHRPEQLTAAYATPMERDPFEVPLQEKIDFLREIATAPLTVQQIPHTVANLFLNRTDSDFFNSTQTRLRQTTTSLYQNYALTAFSQALKRMDSRSSPREAKAGGWELLKEYSRSELDTLIQDVMKKLQAEALAEGSFDVVVDPTVMWDLITDTLLPHLDARRMLERDGARPGGRWLTPDMVGAAQITSPALTLGWDNTLPGGLATCGWDDSGRPADSGTLIDQGKLLRIVGSDEIGGVPAHLAHTRSNSWRQPPHCSMPNIVLKSGGTKTLQRLIESVPNGILIRGRGSIITNPQRTIARIRPQMGWRIRAGEVTDMVRDFEIEVPVEKLWNSLGETGGPLTAITAGELFPERCYPLWTQPFSVSTPAALFRALPVYSSTENAS
ncbi:MAG: metallopeptidase TldD-related protein [Bacteroidia bacterium]|nr:metallopeptidase TldD-related protein [Bacteroidia bacterium]